MPGPKPTPERKSRSGSYVHETQRGTIRARVSKEQAEMLAARWGVSAEDAVRRAVLEATKR